MSFTSATTGMQELHDVMSELSITDDVVKHVIEFIDRMQRLMKKLGGRCDEVTQFEPLASTLESIGCCCRKSIKWLNETVDHDAFEVQCKCRSILARHFDLLESILELYLKKKITPAEVMSHILSKTNQPDEMQKNIHWWETNFGNRTVIPFNEIFNIYCVHYFCDLETSQHNLWRQALYDTMTYIQSDKVTIHEYSYFLLCWYPYSHQSPKSLSLLLRQGCFQPLADRKNYNLLLKAPGDYFVRNTVNQGGGWCLSYLDAYMKAKHVLLVMKTEEGKRGWEFPSASSDRMFATSVVGMLLRNTDKLLIPRGKNYDDVPHLDWENYTHAAGDEEG